MAALFSHSITYDHQQGKEQPYETMNKVYYICYTVFDFYRNYGLSVLSRIYNEHVQGKCVLYEEKAELEEQEKVALESFWSRYWWVAVTVLLLIWMIILVYRMNRKETD